MTPLSSALSNTQPPLSGWFSVSLGTNSTPTCLPIHFGGFSVEDEFLFFDNGVFNNNDGNFGNGFDDDDDIFDGDDFDDDVFDYDVFDD